MAKRRHAGIAGIYHSTLKFLTCSHVMLAVIRSMAASMSTSQTLARKRSKGYTPRIVAGGLYTSSSEDEQDIIVHLGCVQHEKAEILTFFFCGNIRYRLVFAAFQSSNAAKSPFCDKNKERF